MTPVRRETCDVAIVGGGAAGLAAAVGARRSGARVLLVERYGFLGGAATNASVLSYCGFYAQGGEPRPMVRGVGGDLLDTLAALGLDVTPRRAPSGNWIVMLDPEAVKHAFDLVVAREAVDCRMHCSVVAAERDGARVRSISLVDHAGRIEVDAAAFVDASGDADLSFLAGVPTMHDLDAARERQPASFPVRIAGVASDIVIDRDAIAAMTATIEIDDPIGTIRANGGHFLRLPRSNDLWWMGINLVTDGLDSASTTRAESVGRMLAWRFVEGLRRYIRGFESAFVVSTGPQAGIRDSRQVLPRFQLTAADVLAGTTRPDGIARGCWPAEVHDRRTGPRFQPIGGAGYYDIPLDALRAAEVDNLWLAGRVIGCEAQAYASLRVMGTAFATGHAAGVAAALAQNGGIATDDVRARLAAQGAIA